LYKDINAKLNPDTEAEAQEEADELAYYVEIKETFPDGKRDITTEKGW